jgi:cellulose synthase/poly-beta-1,6-N-acetylglucosamine synthase-like glycosyltransferase
MEVLRIAEYAISFAVLYFTVYMLLIFLRNRSRIHSSPRADFEPTVSVVLPAYNEEKNIGRAIRSVLAADYPKDKLEVIVVDDESTDRTAEIVREFGKRVKLLHKKNEGCKAYALNYGIARAKGEIIITLDADSYIMPQAIRKILRHFDGDDVAAVTSAIKVRERKKSGFFEKLQRIEYLFTAFNRRLFSFINSVYVTPGPLSAFRREVFEELGGFDANNIMEDQEYALRIQSANYRIASCMDAVAYTEVPKDFNGLLKQRIRWHRGGIRNMLSYWHLANPKYGDFGAFVMPFTIASVFLMFAVLAIVAASSARFLKPLSVDMFLGVEPINVIAVIIFCATVAWTLVALGYTKNKTSVFMMFVYTIVYAYMTTLFTLIAIGKEVRRDKVGWETKPAVIK